MKTKILKLAALVLLMVGVISCGEKETNEKSVEIPFVEYSLTDTDCWWQNLELETVIAINSNEDLEKYIHCEDGGIYPEIDFSKNTLLLACGIVGGGVGSISCKITEYSQKYVLKVEVTLNDAAIASESWKNAISVNKIKANKSVELKVTSIKN